MFDECQELSITARAHTIMNATLEISDVAAVLRQVNMDRLASRLEFIADLIHETAKPIPKMEITDLNESIAHGQHMMGGLLMLALNRSEVTK